MFYVYLLNNVLFYELNVLIFWYYLFEKLKTYMSFSMFLYVFFSYSYVLLSMKLHVPFHTALCSFPYASMLLFQVITMCVKTELQLTSMFVFSNLYLFQQCFKLRDVISTASIIIITYFNPTTNSTYTSNPNCSVSNRKSSSKR